MPARNSSKRLNQLGLQPADVREVYFSASLSASWALLPSGDEYLLAQVRSSNLKLLLGSSLGLPSLERADSFRKPIRAARRTPHSSVADLASLWSPWAVSRTAAAAPGGFILHL